MVFFIFLYQRYIYRVDPSRVNEFGFSQEMLERRTPADDRAAVAAPKSDADKKAD